MKKLQVTELSKWKECAEYIKRAYPKDRTATKN